MDVLKVVIAGTLRDDVRLQLASLAEAHPVSVVTADSNVTEASAGAHLCIAAGELHPAELWAADAAVRAENLDERVTELWNRRILPFATNLASGRRAPRRRKAIPVPYDSQWPGAAARLIARLRFAFPGIESIEHIGSTSVPGMEAKDLVDLQMVVPDLAEAERVAAMGHVAGFVSAGLIHDIDRDGREVPEYCICDADPGRPVNVHIRPRDSIVWRDTLLLRDWLRAVPEGRAEYIALKRELAAVPGGDVDQYSNDKMPWIASALRRADRWRAAQADTGASQ